MTEYYIRELGELLVKANLGLCACLEKLGKFQTAIAILEASQSLNGVVYKNKKRISEQLVKIYKKLGEREEAAAKMEDALSYYEKCLNACSKSNNKELEAEITMKVSDIYIRMGLFTFAQNKISDFRSLTVNKEKKLDKMDDMNYRRLLAECSLKQDHFDEAKMQAEQYFKLADELSVDHLAVKAEAALKFADILWRKNVYPKKAIAHYDLYFNFCKNNVRHLLS